MEILSPLTIAFSRQGAIEAPTAVHVLPWLPLRDLSHGTDVVSRDRLPLRGIEPHRNSKFLHHLYLILIHQIPILIASIVANSILLLLLVFRNDVILALVLVLVPVLGNDVVPMALPRRRARGTGPGA